jgi:molybdate transport system substrate-binding protein
MSRPFIRCSAILIGLLLSWQAQAVELTISAAASLANAFKEVAPLFEAQHPGTRIQLNLGASGALLQQIAKGAPVDVFASADQESMDQAQAQSLVQAAERRNFASNSLVVVVPMKTASMPTTVNDLTQARYARIAIGLPASVPAGRYAKAALERTGIWGAIEPKVIGAQNVRQALDYVARGEVDAGLVYATDAALMPDKVKVAMTVRTEVPVLYPIAPVSSSANVAAARKFIAFVLTPPARAVLSRHGFGKP